MLEMYIFITFKIFLCYFFKPEFLISGMIKLSFSFPLGTLSLEILVTREVVSNQRGRQKQLSGEIRWR